MVQILNVRHMSLKFSCFDLVIFEEHVWDCLGMVGFL